MQTGKVILVTGCSSGIGAALARELHRHGHRVYATARRPESLDGLAGEGIRTLELDVDDDASIAAALGVVGDESGRLDMLVNNAGISQVGAVLDLDRAALRRQFETNVIGPVALTRAAFDLLRAGVAHGGAADVVNVGSIIGLFTTPFSGAYCASKAALHAISDALRMELAPFGIRTVTVQPGGVLSRFGDNTEARLRLPADSHYLTVEEGIRARAWAGQKNAIPAEVFAQAVVAKLLRSPPPAVIRAGRGAVVLVLLKRLLPLRVFDFFMARHFGVHKLRPGPGA